ncbi:MAG: phosphodiester glycosidase family protein [Bacilli bacterium]
MKKILSFFLLIIAFLFISGLNVNGAFDIEVTTTGDASYQVIERKAINNLGYGVKQFTDIAQTMRLGTFYDQQVNIMEIPASSPAKIISFANLQSHMWTLSTVTSLATQFEEEYPEWRVLGAINADFFDISGTLNGLPYQTHNPVVTNGDFYKTSSRSGVLGFANDHSTNSLIGGKTNYRSSKMNLDIYDDQGVIANTFSIDKLNQLPGVNETSIYFGIYNATTHIFEPKTIDSGTHATYIIEDAILALPNNPNDFYGKGTISSLNPVILQKGQFAICTNNSAVQSALAIGKTIRTQFTFINDFSRIDSCSGYQGYFLRSGEYYQDTPTVLASRNPRTTVGIKADGTIVMVTIDGRQEVKGMDGMVDNEMAATMKRYGCLEAYNLDGGGSTTMIIRKNGEFVVVNSPSDGALRRDGNCLLIAVKMPIIDMEVTKSQDELVFDAIVLEQNGHDIQKLFLTVNNQKMEVKDSPITFKNLQSNFNYYYQFSYIDSLYAEYTLLNDGQITTLKKPPQFFELQIAEVSNIYELTMLYEDEDDTLAFKNAKLKVNGRDYLIRDGFLLIKQSDVGTNLTEFILAFEYDLNDGITIFITKEINYRLISSSAFLLFEDVYLQNNNIINDLYH